MTPVRTRGDHRAFWTLPYEIYRDVPAWAAPLRRDERDRWDPACNPTLQTRQVWRFVAWCGRRAVGRIAAVLDPELAARWAPDTGLFGFFESVDEPEVSASLFHAAEITLRAQGVRRMLGPVNLSFHDEMGLLVDGFDHAPAFLTPFNPPYYTHLVERQGYRPSFDQHAYRWIAGGTSPPVVERALQRAARAGVVIRGLHREQWMAELHVVHTLYNEAFKELWGFVPIGWHDFRARAEGFKSFYRPELIQIAELDGRAVGFALALPDLGPILARIRGRLWPFGSAYLAFGIRRLHQARCMLLGVLPAFTGRGIAVALVARLIAAARDLGFTAGELSLVHQDNHPTRRLIETMGGTAVRTYRVYEKTLS
ncbi:MAG TPA: GNAT family N-acetyltransferase [Gemmatimonadales bacterium]|nr:GNAT family N-acetyltransferase [Gemmatimonadales bacterium]